MIEIKEDAGKVENQENKEQDTQEEVAPVVNNEHAKKKPLVNIAWLVQNNALLYKDSLSQISNNAANELSLEKQFNKIEIDW